MSENARKEHRVPLFGIAEVKAGSDGSGFLCKALTQNISVSGMGLYTHIALEVGITVSVTVRFATKDGKRPSDTIEGKVASVSEMESFYCVGVQFDKPVNGEDQPYLFPHLLSADKQGRI